MPESKPRSARASAVRDVVNESTMLGDMVMTSGLLRKLHELMCRDAYLAARAGRKAPEYCAKLYPAASADAAEQSGEIMARRHQELTAALAATGHAGVIGNA